MIHAENRRIVIATSPQAEPAPEDACSNRELARWLAEIQGLEFFDGPPAERDPQRHYYWVPSDTLVGREQARQLGVQGPLDLFGGYVEQAHQAGKAIVHPLIEQAALTPKGWAAGFAERVAPVVLDGHSAFCRQDAWRCASARLPRGPQRLKPAGGRGGLGQRVVADADELEAALAAYDEADYLAGLAIEDDLGEVRTHSVGQTQVSGVLLSYHGFQQQNRNARGELVYGGSDLLVVRGGFDALLGLDLAAEVRLAIQQGRAFDRAASQCLPHFFASRRNYDVAQGIDAAGRARSGVLEQSWRVGGASGAELAALQAFVADPALQAVRASSFEIFEDKALPANARVIYRGPDRRGDFLLKYAMVEDL